MPEGPITTTATGTPTGNAIADSAGSAAPKAASQSIATPDPIRAPGDVAAVLGQLDRASKQGKLPGFEQRGESMFRALVYGEPFDRELLGTIRKDAEGSVIEMELRMLRKMPTLMFALIAVSIWPGVWLTDSMIQTYFPGYPNAFWVTAVWYLPLTVIPLPWMMRSMWRKSEGIAREELGKTMTKIARAVSSKPV